MSEAQKDQTPAEGHKSETEAKGLLVAYTKILDIWKVQNENYFKRVQVAMGIIQVGLFFAVLKVLSPLPTSWREAILPMLLAVLGILSAHMWTELNEKQTQYMEFCRSNLRNIERRLSTLGVPLEYFTLESLVFGPAPNFDISPYSATLESIEVRKKKRCVIRFLWTQDQYPDPELTNDNIHSVSKVGGGMIFFENRIANGAKFAWYAIIVAVLLLSTNLGPFTVLLNSLIKISW